MMEIILLSNLFVESLPAGITLFVLGLGFAIILLIASQKLRVEVDPKIEQVHQALPKIDCGACGFAGCSSYAKAVVAEPKLLGKCAPGGTACAAKIAEILNLQFAGSGLPLRPIVHCRAHTADRTYIGRYTGIESCTSATAIPGVMMCKFGCLGFGDCVDACKFDALHIINGLATVDYEKCTGCTACSKACPRNLIKMVPLAGGNVIVVACSSQETGKDTRAMCRVGCIACKLCTKQSDVFSMNGNVAVVDYNKYSPGEAFEAAYNKCPTGVIVYRGKNAPADRVPAEKAAAG